jgi:small redox-active disulfide protein 2
MEKMVKIEVLGTSCVKCKSLLKNVEKAVQGSGIQAEIIKLDSIQEIMDRGVMTAPALYLDSESKIMARQRPWKRSRGIVEK